MTDDRKTFHEQVEEVAPNIGELRRRAAEAKRKAEAEK